MPSLGHGDAEGGAFPLLFGSACQEYTEQSTDPGNAFDEGDRGLGDYTFRGMGGVGWGRDAGTGLARW